MILRNLARFIKKFLIPPKLYWVKRFALKKPLMVLDVGCGNASFEVTKQWLEVKQYHGVDREYWHGQQNDYQGIDQFYKIDLDKEGLSKIPDNFYDAIIFSHVIEHLWKGHEILAQLSKKLNKGGVIYVETPSEKTVNFPSADGFLNFKDDPTHTRPYLFTEIAETLTANGVKVHRKGVRRDLKRILLLSVPAILYNLFYSLPFKRRIMAAGLWDLLGVAVFVVGTKT
jgi:2-polyprenyl-3-methyl-5-hydroxy-6-metoxy-1,4-benzoquinol methylase